jgi:chromosome segregation ATPase
VTLMIDNTDRSLDCDSDEVMITRRLYRSVTANTASTARRCA